MVPFCLSHSIGLSSISGARSCSSVLLMPIRLSIFLFSYVVSDASLWQRITLKSKTALNAVVYSETQTVYRKVRSKKRKNKLVHTRAFIQRKERTCSYVSTYAFGWHSVQSNSFLVRSHFHYFTLHFAIHSFNTLNAFYSTVFPIHF